jgi:exonuclease VII small subunit
MDAGTMKDYIEDLIQQVNTLEAQFHKLNEVILQLQEQRDAYKALYETLFTDSKLVLSHLNEALYEEDGWRLREYAIAHASFFEHRHNIDHKRFGND